MHFVLQTPSLQHLAQVKIVAHLWSQSDIFTQIAHSFNGRLDDLVESAPEWKAIEDQVKSKVTGLEFTEHCNQQLLNFIKPLGIHIIEWCLHHRRGNKSQVLDILLPNQLCWSMRGTVDYQKTAKVLVKDQRLSIYRRYEIACINCLQEKARELFLSMAKQPRQEYVFNLRGLGDCPLYHIVVLFTHEINGDAGTYVPTKLVPTCKLTERGLFLDAIDTGNRAMCEYAFQRLNRRQKEAVFEQWQQELLCNINSPCLGLLNYFSLMNQKQKRHTLRTCLTGVAIGLLNWPMQSLLMEMVKRGKGYMGMGECNFVFLLILRKIGQGFRDFDYSQLFREFWRVSPADYKRHYWGECSFLNSLLMSKRQEFIQLILNEAPSRQIEKLFNKISRALKDERVISDAALMECKEKASLESSKNKEDEEKRSRSEFVSRLVDIAMKSRIKSG